MQRKKLEKLQKHLRTLKLFMVGGSGSMSLPNKNDKTRFAMYCYQFDCGMPACVAGHGKYIFNWDYPDNWEKKFKSFFNLNTEQTWWIIAEHSYKSLNPTPETAAKHIQDVLDGYKHEFTGF